MLLISLEIFKNFAIQNYAGSFKEGQSAVVLNKFKSMYYKDFAEKPIYDEQHIAISHESSGSTGKHNEFKVWQMATNGYYEAIEQFDFVEGGYFSEEALKNGSNVVVISTELALKLFGTHHAVGNWCQLGKEQYKVVGVYRPNTWEKYTSDGMEKVFIPLTSTLAAHLPIEKLYMNSAEGKRLSEAMSTYGQLGEKSWVVRQPNRVLRSWASLPLLVTLVMILRKWLQLCWRKEVGKRQMLLVGGGLMIIGSLLLSKVFYILPEALPGSQLLELQYYLSYFSAEQQSFTAAIEQQLSSAILYYPKIREEIWLIDGLQIGLLAAIGQNIYLWVHSYSIDERDKVL